MHMVLVKSIVLFLLYEVANSDIVVLKNPPKPWQAALMARYIVHNSDWLSLATISTQNSIKGYPYVSLKSLSDGPQSNSTGIPFVYMTTLEASGKDTEANSRVTIMATLAESDYCKTEHFDPEDPRCAEVFITGRLKKVKKSSNEYKFGLESLFERHPAMKDWPIDHQFYLAKVNIKQVDVLDYFGGLKHVSIEDYFSANISNIINHDVNFKNVSVLEVDAN